MEKPTNTNTWSIYSFKTLTFRDYKTCLIDKDLSVLVISGEVPHETLIEKWEEIQEEVSMSLGGDMLTMIKRVHLIETLNSKITRLSSTLLVFIDRPNIELSEVFEIEGWYYDRNKIKQQVEAGDIKPYVSYIRNKIGNLQFKLEGELGKGKSDKEEIEPTHDMYADLMAEIRKFEGWAVPDTISILEFCNHYKRLLKHLERNGNRANRQLS